MALLLSGSRIKTFGLNNREVEYRYHYDLADPKGDFPPGLPQAGIDDSSLELPR